MVRNIQTQKVPSFFLSCWLLLMEQGMAY
jgi:hypothetical protein